MGGDGRIDVERELQGAGSIVGGDCGDGAVADGLKEGLYFQTERLAGDDGGLFYFEGRAGYRFRRDVDQQEILTCVVDGHILMRLKEAKLADAFRANAAGGEVGNTAGLELDAHICDIRLLREHGQTHCMDALHWRLDEAEHDVEIVDHEIENNIDIKGTGTEDAEAMRLKKHGVVEKRPDGGYGRIETFKVTRLQDSLMSLRQKNKIGSLLCCGSDGLLDEYVDAGEKQRLSDCMMSRCGHANGRGVEMLCDVEALGHRTKDRNLPLAMQSIRCGRV